jgi:hypothetical protein
LLSGISEPPTPVQRTQVPPGRKADLLAEHKGVSTEKVLQYCVIKNSECFMQNHSTKEMP